MTFTSEYFVWNIRVAFKKKCAQIPKNNVFIPIISVLMEKQLFIISLI